MPGWLPERKREKENPRPSKQATRSSKEFPKQPQTKNTEISNKRIFYHSALDHSTATIRVVSVLPSSRKEPIRCTLHAVPLSSTEYSCLSYRWGADDDEPTRGAGPEIELDGAPFAIHQNLWDFLDEVRRRKKKKSAIAAKPPALFWIDALCIDQRNVAEKNHQVQLMGEIYAQAASVLIWLGKGTKASRATVAYVQRESDAAKGGGGGPRGATIRKVALGMLERTAPATFERCFGQTAYSRELWRSFARICENEYWRRAWILQEVLLARTRVVLVGDRAMDWAAFVAFIPRALHGEFERQARRFSSRLARSPAYSIVRMAGKGDEEGSWRAQSLSTLLPAHASLGCRDPRDRIYSLLSLCEERGELMADYGMDRIQLFFRAVSACKKPPNFVVFAHRLAKSLEIDMDDLEGMEDEDDAPYVEFRVVSLPAIEPLPEPHPAWESSCRYTDSIFQPPWYQKGDRVCFLDESEINVPLNLLFRRSPDETTWHYCGEARGSWEPWGRHWPRLDQRDELLSKTTLQPLDPSDRFRNYGGRERSWTVRFPRVTFLRFLIREAECLRHHESRFPAYGYYGYRFCNNM